MPTTLALIGFEQSDDIARRVRDGLQQHWPGADPIRTLFFPLADAAAAIEQLRPQLVVVHVTRSNIGAGLYALLDAIHEQLIPGVALAHEPDVVIPYISADDLLVCRCDDPVDRVVAQLHALDRRQNTVARLSQELQLHRRCQGGLRGEMSRIQDELQLAALVQREFLPKQTPRIGDVRFGVLFRPTGYVSGDIYDIRRLDEDRIGMFLADAVGHGVPAALLTMVISRSLIMKEVDGRDFRIVPPSEALANLNIELSKHQGGGGRFATGIYAVVNSKTRELTLAGAGHPPPLLVHGSGAYEFLETSGGLLGVFDDAEYEEVTLTLAEDDRLVVYSDGFETAFPMDDADDMRRRLPTKHFIEQFVSACLDGATAADTARRMADALDRQVGSLHQLDDLTAICIAPANARLERVPAGADEFDAEAA